MGEILIGWFGALRRSELVALNFGDLVESRDGLRVAIRRSKTDQEARGAFIGLPRRRDELCPGRDVGVCVLAAGFGTSGAFLDGELDDELAMLAVAYAATVALTHAAGRTLRARGGGALALYSSLLAFQGVPGSAHYAATKAFVQTFAEGIGRELEADGIDVVIVAPGPVHTGFAARAGLRMTQASTPEVVAQATVRRLLRGARTIRPGLLAKLLEASLSTLPRAGRVRVLEKVMAGMRPPREALAASAAPNVGAVPT